MFYARLSDLTVVGKKQSEQLEAARKQVKKLKNVEKESKLIAATADLVEEKHSGELDLLKVQIQLWKEAKNRAEGELVVAKKKIEILENKQTDLRESLSNSRNEVSDLKVRYDALRRQSRRTEKSLTEAENQLKRKNNAEDTRANRRLARQDRVEDDLAARSSRQAQNNHMRDQRFNRAVGINGGHGRVRGGGYHSSSRNNLPRPQPWELNRNEQSQSQSQSSLQEDEEEEEFGSSPQNGEFSPVADSPSSLYANPNPHGRRQRYQQNNNNNNGSQG